VKQRYVNTAKILFREEDKNLLKSLRLPFESVFMVRAVVVGLYIEIQIAPQTFIKDPLVLMFGVFPFFFIYLFILNFSKSQRELDDWLPPPPPWLRMTYSCVWVKSAVCVNSILHPPCLRNPGIM
jgi:hypothetical protein